LLQPSHWGSLLVKQRVFYLDDRGMPQDLGEALRLYRLAADQGHAEAIETFKRLSSAESGK
jgi:TPR repeat protein